MNATSVLFAPLLPWPLLWGLAGAALLLTGFAAWRGLSGWALRAGAMAVLLAALSGPSLQDETRAALGDYLLVVVDESASQDLSDRAAQSEAALTSLAAQVARIEQLELEVVRSGDSPDNRGTRLMSALARALAKLPRDRVAGAVLISDGQVHDLEAAPDMPAPVNLLLTGRVGDWDRRLAVVSAPAYAILGEEQVVTLRIEDQGAAPAPGKLVALAISVDGGPVQTHSVPVGADLHLPVTLDHAGRNLLHFSLPAAEGELTARNNEAVVEITGVRDRLRVLLVSGEPHPGTRTWRNLLKSDSSVDLVHFTILRPPDKQDGVPVNELSLIAFPTQELFMEKIDEFDLIIFDRYKLRGILPGAYLGSVRDYVRRGGAVLVAAGPDFASAESLARSPLGEILPADPTARLIEAGFSPTITPPGARHPVTRDIGAYAPAGGWGRWLRQVELAPRAGHVVMSGAEGAPLLVLDRVGEGRVALLASDHAWLWARGFEGGGPQLELLRRLAHWSMAEPELEEEALTATAADGRIEASLHTMGEGPVVATVTGPDGTQTALPLPETSPGLFEGALPVEETGLYRLEANGLGAVVAVGADAPREFEAAVASGIPLAPVLEAEGGGVHRIETGLASLRAVRPGRPASGRGWIGYTPRGAFVTEEVTLAPLAPAWVLLLAAAGLAVLGWLVEGRGRRRIRPA
jgi:hypothetical protein